MNKRLLHLFNEAGFHQPEMERLDIEHKFEKFAELIVKECVNQALEEKVSEEEIDKEDDIEDRCYLRGNNGGIVDAVIRIKQHFGVKE
jgi:hypothetical protein